jgi:hypothetical protein
VAYWNAHRHPFIWGRRRRLNRGAAPGLPSCHPLSKHLPDAPLSACQTYAKGTAWLSQEMRHNNRQPAAFARYTGTSEANSIIFRADGQHEIAEKVTHGRQLQYWGEAGWELVACTQVMYNNKLLTGVHVQASAGRLRSWGDGGWLGQTAARR